MLYIICMMQYLSLLYVRSLCVCVCVCVCDLCIICFFFFKGLTPFTSYTVSVAALTSQGQGPFSLIEINKTFEGCKKNIMIIRVNEMC